MKQEKTKMSKMISSNFPIETVEAINEVVGKRGMTRSAFMRAAALSYLEDGANDGKINMNLVLLTQKMQVVKGVVPESDYREIEQLICNIILGNCETSSQS